MVIIIIVVSPSRWLCLHYLWYYFMLVRYYVSNIAFVVDRLYELFLVGVAFNYVLIFVLQYCLLAYYSKTRKYFPKWIKRWSYLDLSQYESFGYTLTPLVLADEVVSIDFCSANSKWYYINAAGERGRKITIPFIKSPK